MPERERKKKKDKKEGLGSNGVFLSFSLSSKDKRKQDVLPPLKVLTRGTGKC
jgi:hypothetical protein